MRKGISVFSLFTRENSLDRAKPAIKNKIVTKKFAEYFLVDFVVLVKLTSLPPKIKQHLMPGVYSIMDMTGTFMPAYGLNRIFGELPLIGVLLGNGRDRGLLGITFKLNGPFNQPKLTINPLSIIAPGVFRSIFEFQ
jgi:hypothetical protein